MGHNGKNNQEGERILKYFFITSKLKFLYKSQEKLRVHKKMYTTNI